MNPPVSVCKMKKLFVNTQGCVMCPRMGNPAQQTSTFVIVESEEVELVCFFLRMKKVTDPQEDEDLPKWDEEDLEPRDELYDDGKNGPAND